MSHLTRSLCGTVALLGCMNAAAPAQDLHVGVTQMWPGHELLGDPLGIDVAVAGQPFERIGVRAGVEIYRDDFRSVGSTCVGLIPPGVDCSDEARRDETDVTVLWLTVPVVVASAGRVELALLPAARTAWVESVQVGLESGRTRAADKSMFGYEVGVEAAVAPIANRSLRLRLSGHAGGPHPYNEEIVADGYTPFNDRIGVLRARLGVSLGL